MGTIILALAIVAGFILKSCLDKRWGISTVRAKNLALLREAEGLRDMLRRQRQLLQWYDKERIRLQARCRRLEEDLGLLETASDSLIEDIRKRWRFVVNSDPDFAEDRPN